MAGGGPGAEELEGETVNDSLSGLLMKAGRTLPMGSQILVSLELSASMRPDSRVGFSRSDSEWKSDGDSTGAVHCCGEREDAKILSPRIQTESRPGEQ